MDWEVPATINDTWGFKIDDENWKSSSELIRKLVDVASKGGNYLLNVGPTAEGVIPQPSVERLEAVGRWLDVNGESIYGTRGGPLHGLEWCRTTQRRKTVYVHVFDWPADGVLRLNDLGPIASARVLGGASLRVSDNGDVQLPQQPPDPIDSVIALERA
jgi:alpha-L-fucosidase